MSRQLNISEDTYKKFQAALMLTGEDEEAVLNKLIQNYAKSAFEKAMGGDLTPVQEDQPILNKESSNTVYEQKQLFINWFRSLSRNGKPYNPVTISGYAGRIENACSDPTFETIPINNLFEITDISEYISIQQQIKACVGYSEFDARSHNGFTAALKKYEDFLRFQSGANSFIPTYNAYQSKAQPTSIHRWTMAEDLICCKKFLEHYVINKSNMEFVQFLKMLSTEVPEVSEGSLRMKIQNIKYLSVQAGLTDCAPIKWLSQYSMQCEKAFEQAIKELKL